MEPFHQRFSLQDKTIQYPFSEHERIPIWLAASFAGRPRPDFIDRCNPLPGSVDASPFGLSNSSICQQTNNHIMRDGFKSFVSGHSSLSFSGLGFLSLYLAGKLHIFDNKGHVYKSFVVLFPLAVATYIAITRIQDYRHHWQDVVSGGLIGFILSLFAYHQYYPHLNSYMSHRPLSIRINPPTSDHKATFTFNDGSTFEINVVRKDNTSPLNGVKTIELIKNDISDTQNHNEDNSQIV
ncbi:10494_t:CDS:2 [Scutellospora calospora]|uniref:10494_t:CDS:1 n=1 Tax=Scutellospora calospora TaxID=85575 RepID=A0ACA9KGF3_9GLOM|nr:10494_t:CDS:2 [Scutellospora calospora]